MRPSTWIASIVVVVCLSWLPVQAGHYSFLQQEGPLQRLSDADFALFEQTLIRALDETQDGEVLKWQGAESGAYGSFQPLESYEADGVRCRVMRMFSRAGDRQGEMVFDFCRQPDGAWKVAPRRRSR